MSSTSFLILEPNDFPASARAKLSAHGHVFHWPLEAKSFAGITHLFCRLNFQLDESFLAPFTNLKGIVSPTTGLTHIDLEYCRKKNISICHLDTKTDMHFLKQISSTAEHTWGLILSLVRQIPASHQMVQSQRVWDRNLFRGHDLQGKTLGLIGFGRIGQKVAEYAHVFGMKILAYDPNVKNYPDFVTPTNLETLSSSSDIVSLHASANAKLRLGADFFKQMKPGAFFINTARGELIDEAALAAALRTHLNGAALDVMQNEQAGAPLWQSPLFAQDLQDKIIFTPHLGGNTADSIQKVEIFITDKILAEMTGISSLDENTFGKYPASIKSPDQNVNGAHPTDMKATQVQASSQSHKTLGLIVARGGSKGIPDKNLKSVGDRPLIHWIAKTALASQKLDRVILSSDSARIIDACRTIGVEAPFMRPTELATDTTKVVDVIRHAVEFLAQQNEHYDRVVLFQPTSPLLPAELLDQAIQFAEDHDVDTLISGFNAEHAHPNLLFTLDADRRAHWYLSNDDRQKQRQELHDVYARTGLFYIFKTEVLKSGTIYGKDTRAFIVPAKYNLVIDTPEDLELADIMIRNFEKEIWHG